jgi:hypothetical protein
MDVTLYKASASPCQRVLIAALTTGIRLFAECLELCRVPFVGHSAKTALPSATLVKGRLSVPTTFTEGSTLGIARHSTKVTESRLEGGGVNRQNLKFTTLNTYYKPRLALEQISSPGVRGKTNQPRNKANEHDDLFYRGSVLKNLVPVEVVTKTGSLSTLSLSQTVT